MTIPDTVQGLIQDKADLDGQWVVATKKQNFAVLNPPTEAVLARIPDMGAVDTAIAIQTAHKALDPWKRLTPSDRSKLPKQWHQQVLAHSESLAWSAQPRPVVQRCFEAESLTRNKATSFCSRCRLMRRQTRRSFVRKSSARRQQLISSKTSHRSSNWLTERNMACQPVFTREALTGFSGSQRRGSTGPVEKTLNMGSSNFWKCTTCVPEI